MEPALLCFAGNCRILLELCKVENERDFQRFSVCEHSKAVEKRRKQSGFASLAG